MITNVLKKKGALNYKLLIFYLVLLSVAVGAGWFATSYLGDRARKEIIKDNESAISLLSTSLTSELKKVEGAARSMSGAPWVVSSLMSRKDHDIMNGNSVLDRYKSGMDASYTYLMDSNGMVIASSNRNDPKSLVGHSYQFRPYFTQAIKGNPGRYFALGVTSLMRGFYASHPVRDNKGKIIGVAVIKKDLDEIETQMGSYDHFFFVNRHGIIFLSSKKEMLFKTLWPVSQETEQALLASKQFGEKPFEAAMSQEVTDGMNVTYEGNNYLVSRKIVDPEGWSVVLMGPTDRIFIYETVGVIVTLFICTFIIIPLIINYKTARSAALVRASEELYRTMAEKSFASVYVVQDGKFCFLNSNAAAYSGYSMEELFKKDTMNIVHSEDKEQLKKNAAEMLRGNRTFPYEFRIITKDGQTRWIMETITSIVWEGQRAILGNSMDVTERKRLEEEIEALSITDQLTGLFNRRGFLALAEQQLKIAYRTKKELLLFFIDLDGMKWINDTLGHKKGDEALIESANILKTVLRESDIVARVGGDEFAVLALGASMEHQDIIRNRFQYYIDTENSRDNRDYKISMSTGIACYDPENPCSIDELMTEADKLMYEHKRSKKSP